jgi:hypothetical protein
MQGCGPLDVYGMNISATSEKQLDSRVEPVVRR